MARWEPLRLWAAPAVLAGLIVGFGFHAGGFFPKTVGAAAAVLAILIVIRIAVARQPLEGLGRPLTIAIAAIALLFAWTLASSLWSDAGFRPLVQADRVLLYALALVFFGSWARSDERLSLTLRAVLLAFVVLCAAGLISRLLPDVWALGSEQQSNRLQYPVTYANTMGLLAALALLWSFALSATARESPLTRVLAAAAVPITLATLVLTYSRGAIGAVVVGFAVLAALGATRAMFNAAAATLVPAAVAGFVTFRAEALATTDHASAAALSQGHRVALVLVIAAAGAALLRAALIAHDDRPGIVRISAERRRVLIVLTTSAALVAIATTAIAIDLPTKLSQQHERFRTPEGLQTGDVRNRLTDPGSSERLDAWRIALQDFRAAPIRGRGAGTFALSYNERRPTSLPFNETHSVYLQMLGELGLVGLALIAIALLTIIVVCARRARGPARPLYAAVAAGAITWALAAAVDWQWQMPVGTLALFALGATALAARGPTESWPVPRPALLAIALALVAIAVVPVRVALSERSVSNAATAFREGDCEGVVLAAGKARRMVSARPEPHELLAYCAAVEGDGRRAVREGQRAAELDPHNWRCHYALALVRAAAGMDPRPAVRAATRLNPLEPLVVQAQSSLTGSDPAGWRRQAALIPIVFDYGF